MKLKVYWLIQGHKTNKWPRQKFTSDLFNSKLMSWTITLKVVNWQPKGMMQSADIFYLLCVLSKTWISGNTGFFLPWTQLAKLYIPH